MNRWWKIPPVHIIILVSPCQNLFHYCKKNVGNYYEKVRIFFNKKRKRAFLTLVL